MKALIYFLLTFQIFSQCLTAAEEFELRGQYKLPPAKNAISYALKWSERAGKIEGTYADTFFTKAAQVSGLESETGRIFLVKLPQEKGGVQTLTILSSLASSGSNATSLPVAVITRDVTGNPLALVRTLSSFVRRSSQNIAQRQEEISCVSGFGVLGGYCGVYSGVLVEAQDRRNRCNLLFADAVRLEITEEAMVILHLGELNEFVSTPAHTIGRLPLNPQKNTIDLMSRICGPLSGVNSSSESCKVVHLTGAFTLQRDIRHFAGEYTIQEEESNNFCRYSLSMDRTTVGKK